MFIYNVLKVTKRSSIQEIKNSYRNLAKLHHPDLCDDEGAEIVFKTIKVSYDILSNEYSKSIYDSATNSITQTNSSDFLEGYEREVKDAYLNDLSISMDTKKKSRIYLDFLIVNTIQKLTISRGISPVEIEKILETAYFNHDKLVRNASQTQKTEEVAGSKISDDISTMKTPIKRNSSNWIGFLIFLILAGLFIGYSFNPELFEEQQRQNDARQEEIRNEQIKLERIEKARQNPDLYWEFSFASPNKDDTYFLDYAVDYSDRVNKNQYCVVVGVKATKNRSSMYFLDDSYDSGQINIQLNDFQIGSTKPTNSMMYDCYFVSNMFPITTNSFITMKNGETIYLLFQVYSKVVNAEEPFKYRNTVITDLLFD